MSTLAVIVAIGVGTYLMRLSFIGILGTKAVPVWAEAPLRYVAPAVFAALVFPAVLLPDGTLEVTPSANPRLLAAVLAALAAWLTKSVGAAIVVGLGALWILQALL
jgi:branched-subunit amino acid transport protein